jgi:acyl carrier protein
MTEQDFLKLLKEVAKKAKPFHNELKPIDDMDMVFTDAGLDSLDLLMCTVYLCEIYDVEDEKSKEMQSNTPRECLVFLTEHGRRQPESLEQAVGWIQ